MQEETNNTQNTHNLKSGSKISSIFEGNLVEEMADINDEAIISENKETLDLHEYYKTWDLVVRPINKEFIRCKWVYKIKQ